MTTVKVERIGRRYRTTEAIRPSEAPRTANAKYVGAAPARASRCPPYAAPTRPKKKTTARGLWPSRRIKKRKKSTADKAQNETAAVRVGSTRPWAVESRANIFTPYGDFTLTVLQTTDSGHQTMTALSHKRRFSNVRAT